MSAADRRLARDGALLAARVEAQAAEVAHLLPVGFAGVNIDDPLPIAADDWDVTAHQAWAPVNGLLRRVVEVGHAVRSLHAAAVRALVALVAGRPAPDEPEAAEEPSTACRREVGPAPPPALALAADISRHGPPGRSVAPPSIGAGLARAA